MLSVGYFIFGIEINKYEYTIHYRITFKKKKKCIIELKTFFINTIKSF